MESYVEFNLPLKLRKPKTPEYNKFVQRLFEGVMEYILKLSNYEHENECKDICRNMNYWIEDMKDEFTEKILPYYIYKKDEQVWDKYIENEHLIKLDAIIGDVCKRKPIPYIKMVRNIRKKLEEWCDERDEIYKEFEKSKLTNQEKCEFFKEWNNQKLNEFRRIKGWYKYATKNKYNEAFFINDKCSLASLFNNDLKCQNNFRKKKKKKRIKKPAIKSQPKKKPHTQIDNEGDEDNEDDGDEQDDEDEQNDEDLNLEADDINSKTGKFRNEDIKDDQTDRKKTGVNEGKDGKSLTQDKNIKQIPPISPYNLEQKSQHNVDTENLHQTHISSDEERHLIKTIPTSASTTPPSSSSVPFMTRSIHSSVPALSITKSATYNIPSDIQLTKPSTTTTIAHSIKDPNKHSTSYNTISTPTNTTISSTKRTPIASTTSTSTPLSIVTTNTHPLKYETLIFNSPIKKLGGSMGEIYIPKNHPNIYNNRDTKPKSSIKHRVSVRPHFKYTSNIINLPGKNEETEYKSETYGAPPPFAKPYSPPPFSKKEKKRENENIISDEEISHSHEEKTKNKSKEELKSPAPNEVKNLQVNISKSKNSGTSGNKSPEVTTSHIPILSSRIQQEKEKLATRGDKSKGSKIISPYNASYYLGNVLNLIEDFLLTLYSKDNTEKIVKDPTDSKNNNYNNSNSEDERLKSTQIEKTPESVITNDSPSDGVHKNKQEDRTKVNIHNNLQKLYDNKPHEEPIELPSDPIERATFIVPPQRKPEKLDPSIFGRKKIQITPPIIGVPPSVLEKYPHILEKYKGFSKTIPEEEWVEGNNDALPVRKRDVTENELVIQTIPHDVRHIIPENDDNSKQSFHNKLNEYSLRTYNIPKNINLHLKPNEDSGNEVPKIINHYNYQLEDSKKYIPKYIDLDNSSKEISEPKYNIKNIDILDKKINYPTPFNKFHNIDKNSKFTITKKDYSLYSNNQDIIVEIPKLSNTIPKILTIPEKKPQYSKMLINMPSPNEEYASFRKPHKLHKKYNFEITGNTSLNTNKEDILVEIPKIPYNIPKPLINQQRKKETNYTKKMFDIPSVYARNNFFKNFHKLDKISDFSVSKNPLLDSTENDKTTKTTNRKINKPHVLTFPQTENTLRYSDKINDIPNEIIQNPLFFQIFQKQETQNNIRNPKTISFDIDTENSTSENSDMSVPTFHNVQIPKVQIDFQTQPTTLEQGVHVDDETPVCFIDSTNSETKPCTLEESLKQKHVVYSTNKNQLHEKQHLTSKPYLSYNFNPPTKSDTMLSNPTTIPKQLKTHQHTYQNGVKIINKDIPNSEHIYKLHNLTSQHASQGYVSNTHDAQHRGQSNFPHANSIGTHSYHVTAQTSTTPHNINGRAHQNSQLSSFKGTIINPTIHSASSDLSNENNYYLHTNPFSSNSQNFLYRGVLQNILHLPILSTYFSRTLNIENHLPEVTIKNSDGSIFNGNNIRNGTSGSNMINIMIQIATVFVGGFMIMTVFNKCNFFLFGNKKKKPKPESLVEEKEVIDMCTFTELHERLRPKQIWKNHEILNKNKDYITHENTKDEMNFNYDRKEIFTKRLQEVEERLEYSKDEYENTSQFDEQKYMNNLYLLNKNKENWKTIIETHLQVLEQFKKEEWEIYKGDFLNICLEEFIKEERKEYMNEIDNILIVNTDEQYNIVGNIEKQKILWYKLIEKNKPILEKWKKEYIFQNLIREWKRELVNIESTNIINEQEYINQSIHKFIGTNNPIIEKQKIIWRKWIQKQKEHIANYRQEEWFKKLNKEYYMKNDIQIESINLDINKNKQELREYLINKRLMTNVFVGMYMVVLEEYMKEECTQNKELFLINGKEEILNKPNTEINLSLLEIINDSKWNLCENEKKEEIKIYKKENWFIGLKEDWTKKEYEYLNSITDESIDKNESLLITNKSLSDIHRYISKKHWNDMQMKWIDEDNEMDWIKVAQTQIVNNKKESYKKPKDKKKNIEFNNVQDENVQDKNIQNKIIKINNIENNNIPNKNIKYNNIQNNIIPNKKNVHYLNKIEDNVHNIQNVSNINICKLKNIIEIHMVLLEDSKNEEWTSNKGDFLEICINQYMKEEEEKNKSTIAQLNELINQNNKQMIIQNILHENNKLCFKWIERNKYIQQKWKSQEWFHTLKNNWKIQENYYKEIDKEKKKILEQSKKRGTNIMLERQKLIWKKWLAKHVTHTEIEEHEDTLNKLFTEEEKNKFVSEIENLNISHLGNKHSIDVLKNYSKKKLLTMLWIEIHMKVLEEHKRDEIFEIKAILLDKCINHMKKHQNSEINQRIIEMIVSVKNNTLYQNKYSHVTNDIQNDQGSKQTKFQWINEEYTLSHNSHKDNIAHESKYMIDNNIINIHQGILIKHLDDFQFKWIDDNNEYDWLKISSDENINDKKFNGIQLYKIPTETNKKNDKDHQKKKFYETNIYNESHSEKDSKTIQLNNKTNSENSQLLSKTLSTFNNATNIKDTNNHLNNIIHDTENNKYIPNCEQIDSLNKYKIINYKKVIEIHLTVLEECKNEEWRNIRQLFFETCINEIKNEPWFYQDFFNKENIKEQNYDNIYSQNFIYNEWINENKNLLEIYKKKEWFNSFMHEWKTELNSYNVEQTQKEENKNTKEIYYKEIMDNMFERIQNGLYMLEPPEYNDTEVNFLNINEFQKENIFETQNMNNEKIVNNSNTESKNPMIDYQNMVWRSWIQKHIKNIREEKKEERFNKLIEEHTQGRNIKELQTYTMNKMLITKMFVQIHMMILEEYKKEEYSIMKDIFLDRCMNQIDNLEYSINEKKYMLEIIIEMKKNKSTNKNHKHISDEYKNNILFEELKKEWKYRENEYKNILSNQNMINYYNTKSSINKLFEMQKNIITKHLEDIHLKWIQNEKNRNILIQTFHNPYIHNIKNIK